MKKYHLPILVEIDEDGVFIVSCPLYKGCHSYGKNIDEALSNLKEVAEMCIQEQEDPDVNQFIGVREMELTINATA
jgi:predicted RNase H-like HicB family nuclease